MVSCFLFGWFQRCDHLPTFFAVSSVCPDSKCNLIKKIVRDWKAHVLCPNIREVVLSLLNFEPMIIWGDGGTSVLNRFLMIVVGRRLRAPQFTNAMTSSRGGGGNWPALNIILSFREPRSQLGNWPAVQRPRLTNADGQLKKWILQFILCTQDFFSNSIIFYIH